jgi:transposase-like protein
MCGLDISSTQVSRVATLLDDELAAWRQRPLEAYPYLVLDAHYEKVRQNGSVCSCAVFTAIGITPDGKREILGISVSLSEAEVHWRAFLKSLLDRGLHGVRYIVSDAHDGLQAALRALFNGVLWQRCQFHLQRNAQAYVPTKAMQPQVTQDIRDIFNAPNGEMAQMRLKYYVEKYAESAPQLAAWMETNLPEGLTVFALPQSHRKRMRTTNMLERLHEEINRRTRVARLFPNEASLLRLVSAVEMEISEDWIAGKRYLNMNAENENEDKIVNSNKKRIYRKNVA